MVLIQLLFIVVLEIVYGSFSGGLPSVELLYADDLVLLADAEENGR